jgi:hypothetical protein
MVFTGSVAAINNALNGLAYVPTPLYVGPASLQITTDDLGNTGSGGPLTDTDVVALTITSVPPDVIDVAATTADGLYGAGATILLAVTFDQTVTVDTAGGVPTLQLETGATDRVATYVGGSGTNTLTFAYVVQPGDATPDLDYLATDALVLNGATIRNASLDNAVLALPPTGAPNSIAGQDAVVIDGIAPAAAGIVRADADPAPGPSVSFTVSFSEDVTGVDPSDFLLRATGSATGTIASVVALDARNYVVVVTGVAGAGTLGVDLAAAGTGIADAAGNPIAGGAAGEAYTLLPPAPPAPGPAAGGDVLPLAPPATDTPFIGPVFEHAEFPIPLPTYEPPFVPANFVLRAVAESQRLRAEQARAGAGLLTLRDVAEIRSDSLGGDITLDRVLYVLPAVAEVQDEVERAQSRFEAIMNSAAVGSLTLHNDLGAFIGLSARGDAPDTRAAGGAAPAASPVAATGTDDQVADARAALAALLAASRGPGHAETGTVAAAAPAFTTQLKDAAAKMRPVPLPGTGIARRAG